MTLCGYFDDYYFIILIIKYIWCISNPFLYVLYCRTHLFSCTCGERFESKGELENHRRQEHMSSGAANVTQQSDVNESGKRSSTPPPSSHTGKRRTKSTEYKCSACLASFKNRSLLFSHKMNSHFDNSISLNNGQYDSEPWVDSNGTVNEELRSVFLDNREHIFSEFKCYK